jgi:hypothetical protein
VAQTNSGNSRHDFLCCVFLWTPAGLGGILYPIDFRRDDFDTLFLALGAFGEQGPSWLLLQ